MKTAKIAITLLFMSVIVSCSKQELIRMDGSAISIEFVDESGNNMLINSNFHKSGKSRFIDDPNLFEVISLTDSLGRTIHYHDLYISGDVKPVITFFVDEPDFLLDDDEERLFTVRFKAPFLFNDQFKEISFRLKMFQGSGVFTDARYQQNEMKYLEMKYLNSLYLEGGYDYIDKYNELVYSGVPTVIFNGNALNLIIPVD